MNLIKRYHSLINFYTIAIVIFTVIAIPLTLYTIRQSTENRSHAREVLDGEEQSLAFDDQSTKNLTWNDGVSRKYLTDNSTDVNNSDNKVPNFDDEPTKKLNDDSNNQNPITECFDDAECGGGGRCRNNKCSTESPIEQKECISDAQCSRKGPNFKCSGGICTEQAVLVWQPEITTAPTETPVVITPNPYQQRCIDDADCGESGGRCINSICVNKSNSNNSGSGSNDGSGLGGGTGTPTPGSYGECENSRDCGVKYGFGYDCTDDKRCIKVIKPNTTSTPTPPTLPPPSNECENSEECLRTHTGSGWSCVPRTYSNLGTIKVCIKEDQFGNKPDCSAPDIGCLIKGDKGCSNGKCVETTVQKCGINYLVGVCEVSPIVSDQPIPNCSAPDIGCLKEAGNRGCLGQKCVAKGVVICGESYVVGECVNDNATVVPQNPTTTAEPLSRNNTSQPKNDSITPTIPTVVPTNTTAPNIFSQKEIGLNYTIDKNGNLIKEPNKKFEFQFWIPDKETIIKKPNDNPVKVIISKDRGQTGKTVDDEQATLVTGNIVYINNKSYEVLENGKLQESTAKLPESIQVGNRSQGGIGSDLISNSLDKAVEFAKCKINESLGFNQAASNFGGKTQVKKCTF